MDDSDHKKTHQTKHETTLFLGCFGFSSQHNRSSKIEDKARRNKHWFRRSTFLLKQSATKTVPLDSNVSDNIQPRKSFTFKKSKLKQKSDESPPLKPQTPAAVVTPQDQPPSYTHTPKETRSSFEKKVILENGKLLENTTNEAFCRKIDAARKGYSQPGSPETKRESYRTTINRSTSFPIPIANNPAANPTEKSRVSSKISRKENETITDKFESVIGMSIIMVTLIIMLLWGRLCAILCTCAWLYFVPRLRNNGAYLNPGQVVKAGLVPGEPDFNSEEYKKRVVLEGFLERNHNRPLL